VVVTTPRSIRFREDVLARLDRFVGEHPGTSSSSVANMFIDEALRCDQHPGVVFRPGPTGRRAALCGGPDIWEIVGSLHAVRDDDPDLHGDGLLDALATVTGVERDRLGAALRYYAGYPGEIDERIAGNNETAQREQRLSLAQQPPVRHRP
jgi:hypothetical protein